MPHPNVVIVGAGLAGLSCAKRLHEKGISFRLLEKADSVGGRVQTDRVDGFLLDRGFQVYLTEYPAGRALLDYEALRFRPFYTGALVRFRGAFHRIADPSKHPFDATSMLFSPVSTFSDKVKAAVMRTALLGGSLDDLLDREEMTTLEALRDRWGFSERIIDRFFRPFLGGVVFDRELQASSRMAEFVLRMFASGKTAVPEQGMGAIPAQLAESLPAGSIHLGQMVTAVEPKAVVLEGGKRMEAEAVVVAVEAPEAAALVEEVPDVDSRAVTCLYYAAAEAPLKDPILVLNGDGNGPINNLAVMTNVSPAYSPDDRALIAVAVLGNPMQADADLETSVRAQLRSWFGHTVREWNHLRTYRIPYALPDQKPPFLTPPRQPARLRNGLYVCGDYRRTASINGAMASGLDAAQAIMDDLQARQS